MGIPIFCSLIALLALNEYRYGSPLETGYSQWGQQDRPVFSGDFFEGMYELLFSVHGSIFIHFPILIFSLFGLAYFRKNYPADIALGWAMGLGLGLLYAKMLNPLGMICYGPRYMLVVLPFLSLPFIRTVEIFLNRIREWRYAVGFAVIAVVLLYSAKLQINLNGLPFFSCFRLQAALEGSQDPAVEAYFANRPYGVIAGDLIAARNGNSFPLLDIVEPKLTPEGHQGLAQELSQDMASNYYWFP
jgi:hypothetical protein